MDWNVETYKCTFLVSIQRTGTIVLSFNLFSCLRRQLLPFVFSWTWEYFYWPERIQNHDFQNEQLACFDMDRLSLPAGSGTSFWSTWMQLEQVVWSTVLQLSSAILQLQLDHHAGPSGPLEPGGCLAWNPSALFTRRDPELCGPESCASPSSSFSIFWLLESC